MTVVVCSNCGTKNRVEPRNAAEKIARCGKCGTPLDVSKTVETAGETKPHLQKRKPCRPAYWRATKTGHRRSVVGPHGIRRWGTGEWGKRGKGKGEREKERFKEEGQTTAVRKPWLIFILLFLYPFPFTPVPSLPSLPLPFLLPFLNICGALSGSDSGKDSCDV